MNKSKSLSNLIEVKEYYEQRIASSQLGLDLDTRNVFISGIINEEKVAQFIPALSIMDELKGPIKIFITSHGGDETSGFALFDTIKSLQNPTITIGIGGVYSIAALVYQGGKERLLFPNAQIMVHDGSVNMDSGEVNTATLQQIAKDIMEGNRRYHEVLKNSTGQDLQTVADWCKNERTFSAKESLKFNLADKIVYRWKEIK